MRVGGMRRRPARSYKIAPFAGWALKLSPSNSAYAQRTPLASRKSRAVSALDSPGLLYRAAC